MLWGFYILRFYHLLFLTLTVFTARHARSFLWFVPCGNSIIVSFVMNKLASGAAYPASILI